MPQSTVHCLYRLVFAVFLAAFSVHDAAALTLKPWKDDLFGYGTVVETGTTGRCASSITRRCATSTGATRSRSGA